MSHGTHIDPDTLRFAIIQMVSSILISPHGLPNAAKLSEERRLSMPDAVTALATDFAMSALTSIAQADTFQFPSNGGIADALRTFISVQEYDHNRAFDDTLQEGQLAENAAALLLNQPERWHGAHPAGDSPFPGSGADHGPERINDLVRAVACALGEIARIERTMGAEDRYARRGEELAASQDETVDTTDPDTRH